jgi:hypothetical protein
MVDGSVGELAKASGYTHDGFDPVELDLRVSFFIALAKTVARAADAPATVRLSALRRLRQLVQGPAPVEVPPPDERRPWTLTARITTTTEVDVLIDALAVEARAPQGLNRTAAQKGVPSTK